VAAAPDMRAAARKRKRAEVAERWRPPGR